MSEDLKQDELETIKARLDRMGVTYHPNIGLEKARERLTAAMADKPTKDDSDESAPATKNTGEQVFGVAETEGQKRKRLQREANELVRIRLTCMNPAKKEWAGEIITVGNSIVGTIKKFVPFNAEEGWHVPRFIYEVLKDRQCQTFVNVKAKNGVTVRQGKLIKEFAIELLAPLTPDEIHDLAQRQAMAGNID